jgi:hypothetical protein
MLVPIEVYSAWWMPELGLVYRFDYLVAEAVPWNCSVGPWGFCLN